MMLNSLLLSMQSVTAESSESAQSPVLSALTGDITDTGSPFADLLNQLGLDMPEGVDESDLTALLSLLAEQTGELLPVSSDREWIEGRPMDTELPDSLDSDQLLAFLMANAGKDASVLSDSLPSDLEADNSEDGIILPLATGDLLDVIPEETDESVEDEVELEVDAADVMNDVNVQPMPPMTEEKSVDALEIVTEPLGKQTTSIGLEQPVAKPEESETVVNSETLTSQETASVDAASEPVIAQGSEVSPKSTPVAPIVVEGEMKTELKEKAKAISSISRQPLTSISADQAEKTATISERLQAALQNQTTDSEPLDPEKEPLHKLADPALEALEAERKPLSALDAATRRQVDKANQSQSQMNTQLEQQLTRSLRLSNAGQAIAERIATMVSHEIKQAVIQLDPAELGHLEIRLHVHHDQTQVQIVANNQQARDALEQQSARLREALTNQGLDLAQLDVSDQQSNESQEQESDQGSMGNKGGDAELDEIEMPVEVNYNVGLVDHFV